MKRMAKRDFRKLAKAAAEAVDDKKAEHVLVLDVAGLGRR